MSDTNGEVTFVGGKAVEQTVATESAAPADEREAAIKAVRAALQEEGKKAAKEAEEALERDPLNPKNGPKKSDKKASEEEAKEPKAKADKAPAKDDDGPVRGPDGKFLPKEARNDGADDDAKPAKAKAPSKDADDDAESLKRVLKERKESASQKQKQMDELTRARQEMQQFQQQLLRQQQEIEQEKRRIHALRSDPARAIKEIGYDPEEFILDLAQEGTPEGLARRKAREQANELQQLKAWRQSQEQAAQQQRQQYEQQRQQEYRRLVETNFLKTALDEEKYPHVASFYKGKEHMLVVQGDLIADQYSELAGKTATFDDIADFLESEMRDWYTTRSGSQQGQQNSGRLPQNVGQSTQGSVTGRTLNPDLSSERRSLGTMLKDLDGDERLAAAREAVGAALRASGERT